MNYKIYGERNSGTNYLQCLIDKNTFGLTNYVCFKGEELLNWKHTFISHNKKVNFNALVIYKNIYPWLISQWEKPHHIHNPEKDFDKFVKTKWPTIPEENYNLEFLNPIDLWNQKNLNYRTNLKTIAKKVFFIRYEDLLADPESIIKKILPNNTNANFINCIEGVSPGTKKRL